MRRPPGTGVYIFQLALFISYVRYHNGNDQDEGQLRGFGHVGFLVEDLDAACAYLEEKGVSFKKKPQDGSMRGEHDPFIHSNNLFIYLCVYYI